CKVTPFAKAAWRRLPSSTAFASMSIARIYAAHYSTGKIAVFDRQVSLMARFHCLQDAGPGSTNMAF
ncbi:hypothetical protein QE243_32745, partial [Klebsiella pneumoniae]